MNENWSRYIRKRKGGFWKYHLSTFAIISIFKRLKLRIKTERVWGIGVLTGISSVQQKDSDKNVMNNLINLYLVYSEVWNKVRCIFMEYHICYWIWIYPAFQNSSLPISSNSLWPSKKIARNEQLIVKMVTNRLKNMTNLVIT